MSIGQTIGFAVVSDDDISVFGNISLECLQRESKFHFGVRR